ncbi:MAG: 4Fe-4S binding protein [Coriobacteriales bacterium]|jgi:formate hydrogenlyase subunit 6/NADH:ubiquinone oxidoreductase subunit I
MSNDSHSSVGAAVNPLGQLDLLDGPDVTVHQGRCVRVRNRNASCTACVDACTTGAIAFEDGAIKVTPSLCIGCGTCATACPTCALESHNPDDDALLDICLAAMRANGGHVTFACQVELDRAFGHCDETKVAHVTCLGRVEESLLVELVAAGAKDVALVQEACDRCRHSSGRDCACEVAESASSILSAWGVDMPIELVDSLPESVVAEGVYGTPDETEAPRGDAGRAAGAAGEAPSDGDSGAADAREPRRRERFEKVGRDGTLPQFVPTRRGRLLSTLRDLGEAPSEPVASRLWGEVVIDPERCGSCRMCAVFCPTGALRRFSDPQTRTMGVEHVPGRCVACGTCEAICPHGSVTLLREVYPSDLYDDHAERFEMRPPQVELGRPDTIVNKMRTVLTASKFVSQA